MVDMPFDEAVDVMSIGMRLAPIDVGFDLRSDPTPVAYDATAPTLRASYADRHHASRVVAGPTADVVEHLRRAGYALIPGPGDPG